MPKIRILVRKKKEKRYSKLNNFFVRCHFFTHIYEQKIDWECKFFFWFLDFPGSFLGHRQKYQHVSSGNGCHPPSSRTHQTYSLTSPFTFLPSPPPPDCPKFHTENLSVDHTRQNIFCSPFAGTGKTAPTQHLISLFVEPIRMLLFCKSGRGFPNYPSTARNVARATRGCQP